jgi:hypothetical protein
MREEVTKSGLTEEEFNAIFPDASTLRKCKDQGYTWDGKNKVCWARKEKDYFLTAPIFGAYFLGKVEDLYELTDDEATKGTWIQNTTGCLVNESQGYPRFAGGCSPIYEGDSEDTTTKGESAWKVKEETEELFTDIAEGNPNYMRMQFYNTQGNEVDADAPYKVVSNSDSSILNLIQSYKDGFNDKNMDSADKFKSIKCLSDEIFGGILRCEFKGGQAYPREMSFIISPNSEEVNSQELGRTHKGMRDIIFTHKGKNINKHDAHITLEKQSKGWRKDTVADIKLLTSYDKELELKFSNIQQKVTL